MNESGKCPACGLELPGGRLEGFCPACAWPGADDGAEPTEDASHPNAANPSASPLMRIPGYDVTEEIARGGMGIVYRARQLDPARTVALKMLLPHQLGLAGMERFRVEVRALTELEHPAILPVYQVGEQSGLPFFTMKLATGGTLAQRKGQFAGNWRAIAELVATLADAVQFAHEHGVLHRDLKPGNVLFDDYARPYVSDFGLAKLASADSDLTRSADFLGTPHYVAPEIAMASARQATTASDIYALGAILYELLAGRPPFEANGIPALLKKISEEEPAAPGNWRRQSEPSQPGNGAGLSEGAGRTPNQAEVQRPDSGSVPRDLEVICLKCLVKEPLRRYASAQLLTEDLRRWLAGKPITARPVSRLERVSKWIRRNPLAASMAGALALCLAGGSVALLRSYENLQVSLNSTRKAEGRAEQNLRDALLAQAQALGAAHATGQRWQALDALARAARIKPSIELRNEAAAALARPDLREVARFQATFGDAGSPVVFTSDLARYITPTPAPEGGFALRSTKDQAVLAAFPGTQHRPARWFVLSQDDKQVAALLDDYSLEVWAFGEARPRARWRGTLQQPPACEFHPDGISVAAYAPGKGLFLHHFDGGEQPLLQFTNARAIYFRFDPSGKRLAIVAEPGTIEVLRCDGTPAIAWTQPMQKAVPWLAWTPDGQRLVAGADDGRGIRVFSAENGQTELAFSSHLLYPRQFEVHPNGRMIGSIGQDWVLRLWDARTGQEMITGVGRHRVMRFSSDGCRLTTAPNDRELAVMELAPEKVFREFRSTPRDVVPFGLSASRDGRYLVTSNPEVRIYDTKAGEEIGVLDVTAGLSKCAFFEGDGSAVLYSCFGKAIYRRSFVSVTNDDGRMRIQWGEEQQIAIHPDAIIGSEVEARHTWVRHGKDGIELWQERDPARVRRIPARGGLLTIAASEDARWVAGADKEAERITIWESLTGQIVTNLPCRSPEHVWFSPDSCGLVASVEGGYRTWRVETWNPGPEWEARLDSGDRGEVKFSADSRLVAARIERETFRLLSFPDCRELVTLKPPLVVPVRSACLSGDGSRLWLVCAGYRVFEWNLTNLRRELGKLSLDWE